MRARPICTTAVAVILSAATLAACGSSGSSSSGYSGFAKAKFTTDCEGGGTAVSLCKCELLYAEAHKVPVSKLTAADNALAENANFPQWSLNALAACA